MIDLAALQVLALQSVQSTAWPDEYRRICRWYSTTFFTPLHVVENDLTEEYVLKHYFEHTLKLVYDKSESGDTGDKDEWIKIKERILSLMDEKLKVEVDQRDAEDDAWAAELERQIKEEEKALENSKKIQSKQEFEQPPNLEDEVEFSFQGE